MTASTTNPEKDGNIDGVATASIARAIEYLVDRVADT